MSSPRDVCARAMRLAIPAMFVCALLGGCVVDAPGDGQETQEPALASTTGPDHCGTITEDEVWAADRNPHIVTCHVNIEGGTVTIGPGTVIEVASYYSVSVGFNGGPGGLVASGTAEAPVLFTGLDGDGPGRWGRLGFYAGAHASALSLSHVIVEESGFVAYPTVAQVGFAIDGTSVAIDDLTIRDTVQYGFGLGGGGTFAPGSRGLVSRGSAFPGIVDADVAHSVPEEGVDLTGNTDDLLVVSGNTVASDVRWNDLGVPYANAVGGRINVEGTAASPAVLTLGPGVEVRFSGGKNIAVSEYGGPAALRAEGTGDRPVLLRGAGPTGSDPWDGITLGAESVDASCVLDHVDIGYGGNGFYTYGNIHMSNSSPTIRNSLIHDSASYGLYLDGDAAPVLDNVTFANNANGDTNP